jgi:hypothetical protein
MKTPDRNLTAYLLCQGFTCKFETRQYHPEFLDSEFVDSDDLQRAVTDYHSNRGVPVQSFVAACKHIADQIRQHRSGR